MKKSYFGIAVIVLLTGIAVFNFWNPFEKETKIEQEQRPEKEATTQTGLEKGQMAPDFTLTDLNGETKKLSDYRGEKVILNFWASWCPPCKAEMPYMEEFFKENKDKGSTIVSVNLTTSEKSNDAVTNFVKDYKLTFPVLLDQDGQVGSQYQTVTIPTSYIIDTKGRIAQKIVGPMDKKTMEDLVKNID